MFLDVFSSNNVLNEVLKGVTEFTLLEICLFFLQNPQQSLILGLYTVPLIDWFRLCIFSPNNIMFGSICSTW